MYVVMSGHTLSHNSPFFLGKESKSENERERAKLKKEFHLSHFIFIFSHIHIHRDTHCHRHVTEKKNFLIITLTSVFLTHVSLEKICPCKSTYFKRAQNYKKNTSTLKKILCEHMRIKKNSRKKSAPLSLLLSRIIFFCTRKKTREIAWNIK